jgi:ribose transport system substrate-binding protein
MAKAIGVKYFWDAPEERNANLQIEVIKRAVDNGADALLVAADDPKKISGVIEDAKARGVKVIYVDSPANEEAILTLATNNYEAGVIAGRQMISELDAKGSNGGSIGIVSVAEKENSALREMGFRKVIADDGRFILLETEYTNGDPLVAQGVAERIINENADLIGLYGTNEGTSQGIGNAIKAHANNYIGIGYDRTDINMQLLRDGGLDVLLDQNPYTMGYLGVAQAVAAILGKNTGPDYIDTGITILKE